MPGVGSCSCVPGVESCSCVPGVESCSCVSGAESCSFVPGVESCSCVPDVESCSCVPGVAVMSRGILRRVCLALPLCHEVFYTKNRSSSNCSNLWQHDTKTILTMLYMYI